MWNSQRKKLPIQFEDEILLRRESLKYFRAYENKKTQRTHNDSTRVELPIATENWKRISFPRIHDTNWKYTQRFCFFFYFVEPTLSLLCVFSALPSIPFFLKVFHFFWFKLKSLKTFDVSSTSSCKLGPYESSCKWSISHVRCITSPNRSEL